MASKADTLNRLEAALTALDGIDKRTLPKELRGDMNAAIAGARRTHRALNEIVNFSLKEDQKF